MSNTITIPKKVILTETVNIKVQCPAYFLVDDLGSKFYHCITDAHNSVYCAKFSDNLAIITKTNYEVQKIVQLGTQITREDFENQFEEAMKILQHVYLKPGKL